MPYEADPTEPGFMKGEREVRLTIIRTFRDHLQDPTSAHGMVWPRPGLHRSHLRRRGLQPCGVHRWKGQFSSSRTAVPVRGRPLREPRARAGGRIHARWVLWRSVVPPRASHRLQGARWSAQAGCLRQWQPASGSAATCRGGKTLSPFSRVQVLSTCGWRRLRPTPRHRGRTLLIVLTECVPDPASRPADDLVREVCATRGFTSVQARSPHTRSALDRVAQAFSARIE
jgi:hypothetical protein